MTHPSPIHIAFNIDHNYVQYCAVTLLSAVRNRGVAPLSFHVIANDLTDTDRNKLLSLVQDEPQCSLHFYTPGNDMLDGTPVLDIKPYVPALDVRQTEHIGWFRHGLAQLPTAQSDARMA